MRTLSLVLAALLFAPSALAQTYAIDKGTYLLGGGLSFTSASSGSEGRSSFLTISPDISYFVLPGLALGANASFTRSTAPGGSAATSLGIGPRVAYYFGGAESNTYPYVATGAFYGRSDFGDEDVVSVFSADFSAGMVFMIARSVGLNAGAFYQVARTPENTSGDTNSQNVFGVRGGVTAFIF